MALPAYRKDLDVVKVAGVRIIHDGDRYAETTATPKTTLAAIDAELARWERRLAELRLARGALVRSLRYE